MKMKIFQQISHITNKVHFISKEYLLKNKKNISIMALFLHEIFEYDTMNIYKYIIKLYYNIDHINCFQVMRQGL